ncbi:serine/threonine protein kinase [Lujinxingia vulgaris]|uniref:Serine/threonine protein kinase n=2 Tax=Lujinxingia vulgaris TaxID=2600176 RepID=A0A5C6X0S4_9DELT|nr:serine/threonine protein kinase [Lujinxingia vulgaris]
MTTMDAGDFLERATIIGGKYRLDELIGRGGFSNVYGGVHTGMDRRVAVKIFDPSLPANQDPARAQRRAERFEREARLVSKLTHPNTVTIFDYGVDKEGLLYLVMEYIEGPTLKEAIAERGPFEERAAVTTFLQILASLEEAHHRNMLHRDLKPANIMLTRNFKGEEIVKVLDFGIARIVGESAPETGPNGRKLFLGTPRYAPPEQLRGLELSFATDIFAVGALLYETLVGQPMIASSTLRDCAREVRETPGWKMPSTLTLRPALVEVVERAVSKDPAKRFASASEMLQALEACEVVARDELPDPTSEEESLFGASGRLMDPNVLDPDQSQNYFLWASQPREQRSTPPPSPARSPRHTPARQPRSTPGRPPRHTPGGALPTASGPHTALESDLELDLPRRPSRHTPDHQASAPTTRPMAAATPTTRRVRHAPARRRSLLLLAPLALVLLAAGIWGYQQRTAADDPAAPASSATTPLVTDDEPGEPPPPAAPRTSPFTTEGILLAARSEGWRVVSARDPVTIKGLSYQATALARGPSTLEVTIYQAEDREALDDIVATIKAPDLHLLLDHHVVRIHPRDDRATRDATALLERLRAYRALVYAELNDSPPSP